MDFQAFTSRVVLDTFQKKIEVLEVWQGKVLAGLADGTLVLLEADPAQEQAPWQVVQALKNFGKTLLQMQVWPERSMLLSLDEEGVSLFKLPNFKLHCLANRTRNAQRFAWEPGRAMLAVAVKRKLLLFHYDGNEFVELKDLALPDSVTGMAWLGESVCLGLKKEYALVNANTGAITELFKPGGPCITSLGPSSELLLAKGNVGIFLGSDGRISRKASLTWSDAPVATTHSHPYAIALLPNYMEIRSVQRVSANGLAQVLLLRGMTVAASSAMEDGSIVVASGTDSGIRRLVPVPFRQQAEALADADEFQEALQLVSYIPDSKAEERAEVSNALHTRYGHRLYAEGEFDEAMAHFGMCTDANPMVLLRLFPSLVPPSLLEPLQDTIAGYKLPEMPEPSGDSYQKAVEVLLPYLLSHRSRLATLSSKASGRLSAASRQGSVASTTGGDSAANGDAVPGASPRKAGQAGVKDLGTEQRELLARAIDTAILKAMLATSDSGALLRFVQRPNLVDLVEGESALQGAGRYSELVALYQARGQHEAALDLLRQVSQSPQELPTPPQGAAAELGGVTGVWAAVKCLVTVGPGQIDLVKRHARWILRADPEAGLEMFIQMEEALPPAAALPILTAQAPSLCAPYLETALANGTASAKEYHNDLAGIYLRTLLGRARGGENGHAGGDRQSEQHLEQPGARAVSVPASMDPMDRLKELVLTSEHVDAQHILLMLPSGQLPELRALLLERIGQHQEALRLYVHTMRNPGLAEAYCDRMYNAVAKQQGRSMRPVLWGSYGEPSNYNMYLALIQVCLEQRDSDSQQGDAPGSSNWAEVAQLLGRKHDRIEPLHALQLVPVEVPLKTMLPFLEGALRSAGEKRRNAAVVRSLRRSENLQVREENVHCKQRSVLVSFERACSMCHKRIGNAAFVAYPNGTLAHYSCYKRSEMTAETEKRAPDIQVYDISF